MKNPPEHPIIVMFPERTVCWHIKKLGVKDIKMCQALVYKESNLTASQSQKLLFLKIKSLCAQVQ